MKSLIIGVINIFLYLFSYSLSVNSNLLDNFSFILVTLLLAIVGAIIGFFIGLKELKKNRKTALLGILANLGLLVTYVVMTLLK